MYPYAGPDIPDPQLHRVTSTEAIDLRRHQQIDFPLELLTTFKHTESDRRVAESPLANGKTQVIIACCLYLHGTY
jgi:hypothetical protein